MEDIWHNKYLSHRIVHQFPFHKYHGFTKFVIIYDALLTYVKNYVRVHDQNVILTLGGGGGWVNQWVSIRLLKKCKYFFQVKWRNFGFSEIWFMYSRMPRSYINRSFGMVYVIVNNSAMNSLCLEPTDCALQLLHRAFHNSIYI